MTTVYYATLGGSRILNASRVDQSGADDGDVTNWGKTADFILAQTIYTSKGPIARSYRLHWRNVTDGGSFAVVGATGEISFTADTVLVDGTALTSANARCSAVGGYTWQEGLESEGDNLLPDSGTYSLADEYYTEFQWALDCNSALAGKQYEFELYEVTNGVSIGTCLAQITMSSGAYTMPASAGSYIETGAAVGLLRDAKIAIAAGSYAETGVAVGLFRGFKVAAGIGAYAEIGTTATLRKTWLILITAGSYIETGQAVGLFKGRTIVANMGAYTETGLAVTLKKDWLIPVVGGNYIESGQIVQLLKGSKVQALFGSVDISGQPANLMRYAVLLAQSGAFGELGQTVGLYKGFNLSIGSGTFIVTGVNIDLLWLPSFDPPPETLTHIFGYSRK